MKELLNRFGRWLDKQTAESETPEDLEEFMTLDGKVCRDLRNAEDDEDNTTL